MFGDAVFRRLFLILLAAGSAQGMAMSYTSIWAARTFGLGPEGVAMMYVVSGIAGAIGNPLIGLYSDRIGRRRPFVVGQLVACALALIGYTRTDSYPIGLLLVAFSGFGIMGLTLTTVGDVARGRRDLAPEAVLRILATERTAWAMGIIVGPALAALIVTVTGDDLAPIFVVAAGLELLAAGLAWSTAEPTAHGRARPRGGGSWPRGRQAGLALLVVGMIFLALPAQTRNIYMPLYVTEVLGQPLGAVGPAFTLNACTAVLVMPHVGALSARIGAQRVLYLGIAVGFVYCALQSVAPTYLFTLLLQCLIGVTISFWSTGALIYLQALLPDRSGVAGGLYLTVQQLTPVVSGLALGPVAAAYGIGSAFAATAALQLLALALLVAAHRAVAGPRPAVAAAG